MKLNYYGRLAINVLKVLGMKIRFGKKINVAWKQLWESRQDIRIIGTGKLYIGEKLHIRSNTHMIVQNGNLYIGDGVFLNHNVSITCLDSIVIEEGVTIANNVVIVDHDHNMKTRASDSFLTKPIRICKGAWIGANSVILKGVTIGEGATVAAGSVVTKSVADHHVVAGVPAKELMGKNNVKAN